MFMRTSLKRLRAASVVVTALAMTLSFHSCNESLPLYQEPQTLFTATIDGEYWLSDVEHSMRVYFRITNVFDETIEDKAPFSGSIEIISARDSTIHKTFPLSSANLYVGFMPVPGTLRINPKETIVIKATWDFLDNKVVDDNNRNLVGDSASNPFFSFITDPACKYRKLARTEPLVLQGTVTLFQRSAPIKAGPTIFPLCFVSNFVSVQVCPRIQTIPACTNWPQFGKQ